MKSKKLHWALLPAVVALAVGLGRVTAEDVPAEPAFPTAVCRLPDVFQQYVQTRDMLAQLSALSSAVEAEQEARQTQIQQRQEDLKALQPRSEAFMKEAESIEDQMIELRSRRETQQARLRRQHRQMTEAMYASITKVIGQIAAERGILIVLNATEMNLTDNPAQQLMQAHVLYSSDTVDITADVISRLNEQYTPQQQPSS